MAEYIDRELAVNAVYDHFLDSSRTLEAIQTIPSADVAPVVRCRSCRYAVANALFPGELFCSLIQYTVPQDGFCFRGKRQTNAEEG